MLKSSAKLKSSLGSSKNATKQTKKRYTPFYASKSGQFEVQHLNSINVPGTARCLCSSLGSNSSLEKFNSSQGAYENTETKEGSSVFRELSIGPETSEQLESIKTRVAQTLHSYKSYCSSLQKQMKSLRMENEK